MGRGDGLLDKWSIIPICSLYNARLKWMHPDIDTWAHHPSENPALPVLDRVAVVFLPLLEDGVAAAPVRGCDTAPEWRRPAALQHTTVILAVDLQRQHKGNMMLSWCLLRHIITFTLPRLYFILLLWFFFMWPSVSRKVPLNKTHYYYQYHYYHC